MRKKKWYETRPALRLVGEGETLDDARNNLEQRLLKTRGYRPEYLPLAYLDVKQASWWDRFSMDVKKEYVAILDYYPLRRL